MKKIRWFSLVIAFAAVAVTAPGCASKDGEPSTLCKWVLVADKACGNAQPIPTPPESVKAELLGRVELQRQINPILIIGTACAWVHQAAEACRNAQPIPPVPANVARDFAHNDER